MMPRDQSQNLNAGIVGAGLMPHPPIMLPEVGRGRESECSATIRAALALADEVAVLQPETILVVTPHGPMAEQAVSITVSPVLSGHMGQFGASGVRLERETDTELAGVIADRLEQAGIPVRRMCQETPFPLDHGVLVPLYHLMKRIRYFRIVQITTGFLPAGTVHEAGKIMSQACRAIVRRVFFLASGDLSHCVTRDSPYPYNSAGARYDRELIRMLQEGDVAGILGMEEPFLEQAAQCGHLPVAMMLGAMEGKPFTARLYGYEAPFGIGYAVLSFTPRLTDEPAAESAPESPLVRLARRTIRRRLEKKPAGEPVIDPDMPAFALTRKAGVFVSLHRHGQLRGCIGTIFPVTGRIADEIAANAVSAAFRDPRFAPLRPNELEGLEIHVDVLSEPEPVRSREELDPARYGVIVRSLGRTGLLLPDLEGVDNVSMQLGVALQKAGIRPDEDYTMERFTVTRYT